MLTAKERITFILKEIEGNDTKSVDLTEVNETQIEELLNTLQQPEYENFTTTINLPEPFKNHRLQIQLDNLISNRQLNKNSQATTASLHSQPLSKPMIEKRVLPSGHIAPKIEITLYEAEETEASIANIETAAIDEIPNSDVVKPLERGGIAESMLMKILNQPLYQHKKTEWEQITHREQAKLFRQNPRESLGITNCKDHPLNILLESEPKLKEMLQFWVTTLHLDLAQYDALLDVLGRHGPSGLERLFHSWSELSAHNAIAFKDMYHALLKKMPTYAPFIENPEFQDTLENIALLGKEKYSWWHALIRNHTQTSNFNDLPTLYRTFIKTTKSMEDMGLNFAVIDEINYKNDLPTTLTHMISLLNRCAPQDRPRQFSCIHEVSTLDNPKKLYFIVPEMNNKPYIEVTIKDLKTKKDTELLKKTVYCYLATQPCHLPLTTYANYLDAILNNSETSDEFKCKMAYILAKTTSSTDKTGFEIQEIAVEWQNFQTRIESLEALERMKANRGFFEKAAFETGLRAQGTDGPRLAAIQPIINMNPIPPISFLNKLLKSSEYKFLDPSLSLIALQGVQNEMMKTIEAAAAVYTLFPENMMHAIHFIKTETVTPDQNGQYFPDPKDVPLLEQFVNAAQRLTDKKNTTAENPERMPQNILLPILTVFHLEYLSSEELTTCINTYLNHINNHQSPDHQSKIQILLPYALSLFRWIKDRELPTPLNQNILNQIQNDLIKKITQNELSTKKDVRLWINQHYSDYFEQNKLLDIKDEINIDQELNEHNVVDPYARLAISSIVSNFNELEEEKDQLKGLTEQLIEFEKTLSRAETTRFYTYCNHALKTDKPLSRNRQTPPPSYLLEFQSLIHTLTSLKSIETFQQFMEISEDRVLQASSDGKNNLAKCNYLLTTLYPDLLTQGIPAREAFQFASEIVCSSPKEVLIKPILDLKLASSEQAKKQQISKLCAKIKHLHQKIQPLQGFIELHELNELKKDLETMVTSFPPHADLFQEYKQVIDTIENLQTENENFYKKSFFGKLWQVIFEENKTWETRLKEAGLFSLTETDGPLIRDLTEAVNRQGVSFQDLTIDIHRKKIEFLNKYPSLTLRANNFIHQALRIAPETPYKNYSSFVALIDQLIALDDQNIVFSLMYHYQGAADDRDVKNLAALLNSIEFQALLKPTQKQVLHALVTQLNNGVDCTRQDIEAFVTFIHNNQNNPIVLQYLDKYYQHAPFPSLSTFMHWMQPPCEEEQLKKIYANFDKNPCALNDHDGREPENGFKRSKALTQLKLIPEIHAIFTEEYLNQIETTAEEAKQRSTEELLKEVKQFKNTQPKNHIKLAMYTIELMHRFKGRKPQFVGEKPIPGRSYELNTTQIISILAMLETGHKVTAQIGTGEGKSRIMMILNACQFLKGNTVDFITSDLALAERDYLEALPFYDSLGAKVSFITATSKIEDYQMDGINVSDPTNRCQFRSKAFSQKKSELVLNPDPKKRALHLDEADVTYYDRH